MWGAILRAGTSIPRGKPRRPRPLSSGPKRGKPTRRVTDPTSRAAIRRAEARKRGGRGRTPTPRKPWGTQGGPRADAKPTGRGPRTSRTTLSAVARSRSRRPKRTTSQAAIARSRARIARRR